MMGKAKLLFLLSALMMLTLTSNAQNGQSEVRFVISEPASCADPYGILVDVEVRAAADPGFFMSEQNYRFSFNDEALANPAIDEEILTGFLQGGPGPMGFTLYSTHNLVGSLDTVVSYNVELQGGDGTFVTTGEWVLIGRLGFDVLDESACFDLTWHPQNIFPPTFVGEVYMINGTPARSNTRETTYGNVSNCISDFCNLPVQLVSFTGEARDCETQLTWTTATEANSAHFVIERSYDGSEFIEIGRVTAAGDSQTPVSYNFTDTDVALAYYRLKQVDIDGTHSYSDVIRITSDCFDDATGGDILDVYPNPVRNTELVNLKLHSNVNETARITVVDIDGRVIINESRALKQGINTLDFSVAGMAAGTYFVRLEGSNWYADAQKFIKIND